MLQSSTIVYIGATPTTKNNQTPTQASTVSTSSTVATADMIQYTLDFTPTNIKSILVFVDNTILGTTEYTLIGNVLYFDPPVKANSKIQVISFSTTEAKNLATLNLTDVSSVEPTDKQFLVYDKSTKQYIPANITDITGGIKSGTDITSTEVQSLPNQINFPLPFDYTSNSKIQVYKNGTLLGQSDYTINGNVCQLIQAVPEGIIISFVKFDNIVNDNTKLQNLSNVNGTNLPDGPVLFNYSGSTGLFTLEPAPVSNLSASQLTYQYIPETLPITNLELPYTPTDTNSTQVYIDGLILPDGSYTINGNIIYFSNEAIQPGKIIKVVSIQAKDNIQIFKTTDLYDYSTDVASHNQVPVYDATKQKYVPSTINFVQNVINTCRQSDIVAYNGQTNIPIGYTPSTNSTSLVMVNDVILRKEEYAIVNDTLIYNTSLATNDQIKIITFDNELSNALTMSSASDVNISSSNLTDGQALMYDSNSGKWSNRTIPSTNLSLSNLSDIEFKTNPVEGDVISKTRDGSWTNTKPSIYGLKEVDSTLPYDGDVLTWDNIKLKALWKPSSGSSTGIDYTNAREGYILTYVSTGMPVFLPIPTTPVPSVEQTIPDELLIPGNTFMVGSDRKLISFDINSILSDLSDKITDLYQKIDSGTSLPPGPLVPFSFTVNDTSTTSIMVTGVYTINSKNLVFIGSLLQYNDQYTITSNSLKFIGNPIPVIPNNTIITVYKFELGTSFEYGIDTQTLKSTYLAGNTIMVFDNGAFMPPDEYTIIDGNISFIENMPQSSIIEYVHFKTTNIDTETFVSDGIISHYTITGTIKNGISQFIVFVGKLYQPASSYSISNQILTFDAIIETGEKITIYHIK